MLFDKNIAYIFSALVFMTFVALILNIWNIVSNINPQIIPETCQTATIVDKYMDKDQTLYMVYDSQKEIIRQTVFNYEDYYRHDVNEIVTICEIDNLDRDWVIKK